VRGIRTSELVRVFICWFWVGESFSFARGADGWLKPASWGIRTTTGYIQRVRGVYVVCGRDFLFGWLLVLNN